MLVARTRIMVLDEATANLDYSTEEEVKKTIEGIRRSTTVIIIAHRYSMVRDADHVIVLSEGSVLEQGSPAALLEKDGWFTRFARAAEQGQQAAGQEAETAEEEDEDGFDENAAEDDYPEEEDSSDEDPDGE
jgi:ABC-type transport system involved in cytochrome bd biosynthesis fused ATPase/permease subunit